MCTPMLTAALQAGFAQPSASNTGRRCQCSRQRAQPHEAALCSKATKALNKYTEPPHGPLGCRGEGCSRRGKASTAISRAPSACASQQPASMLRRINSSTKWTVSSAAALLLLLRHDSATLWCLAGSVASAAACKVHPAAAVGEPRERRFCRLSDLSFYWCACELGVQPGLHRTSHSLLRVSLLNMKPRQCSSGAHRATRNTSAPGCPAEHGSSLPAM